jgi:hypothetical protein
VPVFFFNDEELIDITVPLVLSGTASLDSVSFAGSILEQINRNATGARLYFRDSGASRANREILLRLITSMIEPVSPGRGLLMIFYFTIPDGVRGEVTLCEIDTTFFPPGQNLAFTHIPSVEFVPQFTKLEIQTLGALAGDVDQSGAVDIEDVAFLIDYVFRSGPSPSRLAYADVNCDCKISLSDVIYLINYLFKSGPAPQSGCISTSSNSKTSLFRSTE